MPRINYYAAQVNALLAKIGTALQPGALLPIERTIGDLADLSTTNKDSVVGAVNELWDKVDSVKGWSEAAQTAAETATAAAQTAVGSLDSALVTEDASGAMASFSDGADGVPVKSLTASIVPEQSGTGDPSPANIRPINGWSEAIVTRTGKNLLKNNLAASVTQNGLTFTKNADGSVTVNGTATANTSYIIWSRNLTYAEKKLPAGIYTLSGCPSGVSSEVYMQFQCTRNGNIFMYGMDTGSGVTGTVLQGDSLQVTIRVGSGIVMDNVTFYPQLETGTVSTAYEPYNGITYDEISWQSEVRGVIYGGTLNVTTGVLTVTKVLENLSSLDQIGDIAVSEEYGSFARFISSTPSSNIKFSPDEICAISDRLVGIPHKNRLTPENINKARIFTETYGVILRCSASDNVSTREELFTKFSGAQIVFDLINPKTYQLTPMEVTTLLGKNNIWCSTARTGNVLGIADVSATYRADTKMYIDGKIAELQERVS